MASRTWTIELQGNTENGYTNATLELTSGAAHQTFEVMAVATDYDKYTHIRLLNPQGVIVNETDARPADTSEDECPYCMGEGSIESYSMDTQTTDTIPCPVCVVGAATAAHWQKIDALS